MMILCCDLTPGTCCYKKLPPRPAVIEVHPRREKLKRPDSILPRSLDFWSHNHSMHHRRTGIRGGFVNSRGQSTPNPPEELPRTQQGSGSFNLRPWAWHLLWCHTPDSIWGSWTHFHTRNQPQILRSLLQTFQLHVIHLLLRAAWNAVNFAFRGISSRVRNTPSHTPPGGGVH